MTTKRAAHGLSISERILYGTGQIAESVKNISLAVFILFYYNNLLGMDAVLAGLSMLLALIVDSVADPLVGAVSDNWRSRWGRRHPFMYAAIVPLVCSFYWLFAPPESVLPMSSEWSDQWPLFLWLTGTGIVARLCLSVYCVAHFALGAELAEDYHARTQLAAWREGMSAIGSLAVYAIGFWFYFDGPLGQRDATAYPGFALTLSMVMGVAMLASAVGTHHLIPRLARRAHAPQRISLLALGRETVHAFGNVNFRWYFSGAVMLYMLIGVDTALSLYVNTYIWHISGQPLLWVSAGAFIGYLIGAMLSRALHARMEKKNVLILGTAWFAFFQLLPIPLWLMGWLPAAGSAMLVALLTAIRIVQGIGTIQFRATGGSMLADIADEYELQSGKRQEGVFFGAQMVTYKATSGLGKFISGVFLTMIAWPTTELIAGGALTQGQLIGLAVLYGPAVSVFALVSIWCYSRYRLNAAEHQRIAQKLEWRATRKAVTARRERNDVVAPAPSGEVIVH